MTQNESKKACVLFRSIVEAADELNDQEALELYKTYARIGLGEEVDLNKCSLTVRLILKQNIESLSAAERRRQAQIQNGPIGKESGGGVGRPRKGESQEEYQKRVEEWRNQKPLKTPKNPIGDNNPNNSLNNPVKNPVIEKSPSDISQNPSKPLEVEVEVETEVEKEVDNNNYILTEKDKEFSKNLGDLCYKFIERNPYYNYTLDIENFQDTYTDKLFAFQQYVKEKYNVNMTLRTLSQLLLHYAN